MATLIGTDAGDTLTGGNENDLIAGLGGGDSLVGGEGNDTILGDANYTVFGSIVQAQLGQALAINDVIVAGGGNDWILATSGDIVDGGAGIDLIDIDARAITTAINLDFTSQTYGAGAGAALGGIFSNIEVFRFWLGSGNDTFVGSADHDYVDGGAGNDLLSGGDGNDTLLSGNGNDTVNGGAGERFVDPIAGRCCDVHGMEQWQSQ
ncbi:MAG: calcium-binding protein [Hyphomonadaceae bacterium]|nr:calcium-binding protein [Hyphomonadaceae bacterium]